MCSCLDGVRVAFQVLILGDWGSNPIGGSILFISWILNNLHYISIDLKKDCQTGPTKRENPNVGTAMRLFVSYLFAHGHCESMYHNFLPSYIPNTFPVTTCFSIELCSKLKWSPKVQSSVEVN